MLPWAEPACPQSDGEISSSKAYLDTYRSYLSISIVIPGEYCPHPHTHNTHTHTYMGADGLDACKLLVEPRVEDRNVKSLTLSTFERCNGERAYSSRIIKFLQSQNVPMLKRLLSNWKHIKVPHFEPLPVSSLPIPLQSSKGPTKGSGCAASMSTRLDFKTRVTF